MGEFSNRTVIMSGGSRGIGLAIAHRLAREGANVAIIAKTAEPAPAASRHDLHGGRGDRGSRGQRAPDRRRRPRRGAGRRGGCRGRGEVRRHRHRRQQRERDQPGADARPRGQALRPDAARSTRAARSSSPRPPCRTCATPTTPTCSRSRPPLLSDPKWLNGHSAYTLSKMGMTMITLGLAADEAETPSRATACGRERSSPRRRCRTSSGATKRWRARTPDIYADAAYEILRRDPRECTGNAYIDDEVLAEAGITDLSEVRARRVRPPTRPVRRRVARGPLAILGADVLRNRNFRLLLAGQAVSALGDRMVVLALAFAVLEIGGSASDVGLSSPPEPRRCL